MLDEKKIQSFWQERGAKYIEPCSEMTNLEPDPRLQALKSSLEQEVVFSKLNLRSDMSILEPGAGYGQWAMRFAPYVKSVCAVDFVACMIEAGRKAAARSNIGNIEFILSPAEYFCQDRKFDLIFISGLFMYLNDEQAENLAANMKSMLAGGGQLFLRESVSLLPERYLIDNKWSPTLGVSYSALYRTPNEFKGLFSPFPLVEEGWFFPEGSPLNKWQETRLAYFSFRN